MAPRKKSGDTAKMGTKKTATGRKSTTKKATKKRASSTAKKAETDTTATKKTRPKTSRGKAAGTPASSKSPAASSGTPKKTVTGRTKTTRQTRSRPATATNKKSPKPVSAAARHRSSNGPRYFFKSDIPERYDETYLVAVARDPEWIYTYWETARGELDAIQRQIGERAFTSAKRVLRLLDVTDIDYDGANAWSSIDIEIAPFADSWFIKVPQPGRSYLIEHGLLTVEGEWVAIKRSESVMVPHEGVSQVIDDQWSTVESEELIRASISGPDGPLGSSDHSRDLSSLPPINAPSSR